MEKTKLDEALKLLEDLKKKIKLDAYDLTNDDHEAICLQIDNLKKFIQQSYESHKVNKN